MVLLTWGLLYAQHMTDAVGNAERAQEGSPQLSRSWQNYSEKQANIQETTSSIRHYVIMPAISDYWTICDGSIKEKKNCCSFKRKKNYIKGAVSEKHCLARLLVRFATLSSLSKSVHKYLLSTNGPGPRDTHTPSLQPELYPKPSLHLVPLLLKNLCGFPTLYRIKWADFQLLPSPSWAPHPAC